MVTRELARQAALERIYGRFGAVCGVNEHGHLNTDCSGAEWPEPEPNQPPSRVVRRILDLLAEGE
jgi:hypothetical protein